MAGMRVLPKKWNGELGWAENVETSTDGDTLSVTFETPEGDEQRLAVEDDQLRWQVESWLDDEGLVTNTLPLRKHDGEWSPLIYVQPDKRVLTSTSGYHYLSDDGKVSPVTAILSVPIALPVGLLLGLSAVTTLLYIAYYVVPMLFYTLWRDEVVRVRRVGVAAEEPDAELPEPDWRDRLLSPFVTWTSPATEKL